MVYRSKRQVPRTCHVCNLLLQRRGAELVVLLVVVLLLLLIVLLLLSNLWRIRVIFQCDYNKTQILVNSASSNTTTLSFF